MGEAQSWSQHAYYASEHNVSSRSGDVDGSMAVATTASEFLLAQPRILLGLFLFFAFVQLRIFTQAKSSLPPGVKPLPRLRGLPWAGRFWDVPAPGIEAAWHFGNLHKKMGPIYEWKVMGVVHIWIETDKIAKDLFITRQRNYCDRNELPAAVGVREGAEILPLMGYGEQFRRYKNFMHRIMRHATPNGFYGWPAQENRHTLRRLLDSPERWSEHMIVHCARTIAGIAWADPEHGNKLLTIIPTILKAVSPAGGLVNKLTFLSSLPTFLSPFKQREAVRKQEMTDAYLEALRDVERRVAAGESGTDCWSRLWVEADKTSEPLDPYEAAHAIGSSSFVAIATVGGPLHAFFLAMCHYPSCQARLQEELDAVCPDRPPLMADMPRLPRLRATVKEVVRWRQATPLGVPHVALEDDVYDGYHIPKGAILHANHYLISRDETLYPSGNEFIPDRWLSPAYPTYREPLSEHPNLSGDRAFGYGNRSCPGVDLTQCELLSLIGSIAWAFRISRPEGRLASAVPWYETAPWVITMSKPFRCEVVVRDAHKAAWIRAECPDGTNLVRDKQEDCTSRWHVARAQGEEMFAWGGLTDQADVGWKEYPEKVRETPV